MQPVAEFCHAEIKGIFFPDRARFPRSRWLAGTLLLIGLVQASFVYAQSSVLPPVPLTKAQLKLIAQGFDVFTKETFAGNGRTCSTCHLPDKNYNITPADIAQLTGTPRDLVFATNTPDLENATLVEKLALFNINEDHEPGNTATPVGPFRASMTVAGLGLTTLNNFVCRGGDALEPLTTFPGCALSLAGTKDGVNTTFTVPNTNPAPNPAEFFLYLNGILITAPTHYTLSGSTITMAVAPSAGARLVAYFPGSGTAVDDGARDINMGWAGNGAIIEPSTFPAGTNCANAVDLFAANPGSLNLALRTFSLAAVKTHFPLTLNRVANVDFRCPTPQELDAIAAFQQWLGRRFELDLAKIKFRKDPVEKYAGPGVAEEGRALFMGTKAACNACHFNGGASGTLGRVLLLPTAGSPPDAPTVAIPGANKNSRTGVDALRVQEVILNDVSFPVVIPRDPADKVERGGLLAGFRQGGFNIQSLIEAPRKKTLFHNGAFSSVEDAAAFYFTLTFDASQSAGRVKANAAFRNGADGPTTLAQIGGTPALNKLGFFLRSLSAYYSLADCERLVKEMIQRINLGLPTDLPMIHCQFALNDVKYVLSNSRVTPKPYTRILSTVTNINNGLVYVANNGTAYDKKQRLQRIVTQLRNLRNTIATTPELP